MKSLDLAAQYLGVQETAGPNDGPILKAIRESMLYLGAPPCPWCALFVSWILCRSYAPADLSKKAYRGWLREHLGFGNIWIPESCRAWVDSAWNPEAKARLAGDRLPGPGDLFVLRNSQGHAHHIGFVTEALPEREFGTLEGNTNSGGSVNGDGVYRRVRTADHATSFIILPDSLKE